VFDCRLIIDPPSPGPRNMAVDEALLLDAAKNGVGTLRFYQWSEPTLSLGYFQRYEDRNTHAPSSNCAVVRRQSGGGAILHDRELTYSLSLPAEHPFARQAAQLYTAVHEAFIAQLSQNVASHDPEARLIVRRECPQLRPDQEPFLCFQRRACGDVVYVPSGRRLADWKILGSAQRRHRGAILQHGSLLLEKSIAAPELHGLRDLTGLLLPPGALALDLANRLSPILGVRLIEYRLSTALESKAADLTNTKYGTVAWTKRR
jgi:lipoate-protein ligase A